MLFPRLSALCVAILLPALAAQGQDAGVSPVTPSEGPPVTPSEGPPVTPSEVEGRSTPAPDAGTPIPTFIGDQRLLQVPRVELGVLAGSLKTAAGDPVSNATLLVERSDKIATTDAEGRFRLELPVGRHRLFLSPSGFLPESPRVTVSAGQTTRLDLVLQPLPLPPESPAVMLRKRGDVARITLGQRELHETAGTLGDPLRALLFLPGTSQLLSGLPNPIVRGMQPGATSYEVDGVRLTNPHHLFVGPTALSPDFIESVDLYRGLAPVHFGRGMSAVDIRIPAARDDRTHAAGTLDLLSAGLFVDVPILRTGTNVTLAGRFFYTPFIAAKALSGTTRLSAVLLDGQARVEQAVGEGKLRFLLLSSADAVGSDNPLSERLAPSWSQNRVDVRFTHPLAGGELEAAVTVGVDRALLSAGGTTATWGLALNEDIAATRAVYTRDLREDVRLTFGFEAEQRSSYYRQSSLIDAPVVEGSEDPPIAVGTTKLIGSGNFLSFYAQAFYARESRWAWIPGVRVDSFSDGRGHTFLTADPRLIVHRTFTENLTAKLGAGIYHLSPSSLVGLPGSEVGLLRLGIQEGFQLDTGVEWHPLENLEVSADAYYNPLFRTVEASPLDSDFLTTLFGAQESAERRRVSRGNAWGFELFLRRPARGAWYGWVSYSYQQSWRRFEYARRDALGEQIATHYQDLPFALNQVHVLAASGSVRLPWGIVLGASVHLNSGGMEGGGLSSVTRRETVDARGVPVWVDADQDAWGRLPPFFRLDARVAKVFDFGAWTLEAALDVQNVTLSKEIWRYSYSVESDSLAARERDEVRLVRRPSSSPVPTLPMLTLKAVY